MFRHSWQGLRTEVPVAGKYQVRHSCRCLRLEERQGKQRRDEEELDDVPAAAAYSLEHIIAHSVSLFVLCRL